MAKLMVRLLRSVYTAFQSDQGGAMGDPRERVEVKADNGVIIVKGVAPQRGTKLTSKRISRNLRSLNRSWNRKSKGHSV
jgi:hypothetical protein